MSKDTKVFTMAAILVGATCTGFAVGRSASPVKYPDDFSPEYRKVLWDRYKRYTAGDVEEILQVDVLGAKMDVSVVDSGPGEVYGFAVCAGEERLFHAWILMTGRQIFRYNDNTLYFRISTRNLHKPQQKTPHK